MNCNGCWWRGGERCYNEKIATITIKGGFREGHLIDQGLQDECLAFHGYKGKRAVYEQVIPSEMLVIMSEGQG